jgi:hypothetical protein
VLVIFGSAASCWSQSSISRQIEITGVREIAGVTLRPAAAQILDAVEQLYGKSIHVVFRDDLREGIQGYSDTSPEGDPVLGVVPVKGQNEENIVHELFHLKMQAEGYPLFDFEMPDTERVARGEFYLRMRELVYDPITHSIFYPKMRQMGLDPDADTRHVLRNNRSRAEQAGTPQPSQEWLATYLMKVSLETGDSKTRAEVEQWYQEKGWTWALERGKALLHIAERVTDNPESVASIVVSCFNELLAGRAELSIARVDRRKYGAAIKRYVIVRVQPRSS